VNFVEMEVEEEILKLLNLANEFQSIGALFADVLCVYLKLTLKVLNILNQRVNVLNVQERKSKFLSKN
jgi:hypothetical protein